MGTDINPKKETFAIFAIFCEKTFDLSLPCRVKSVLAPLCGVIRAASLAGASKRCDNPRLKGFLNGL